ncbi:10476_t:CDS:2, partial [Dentiscutata erythropus]
QPNTIIELRSALQLIYPIEYEIGDREFRAWKAMLKNVGCSDITHMKKISQNDRSSLSTLYDLGFVTSDIKNAIKGIKGTSVANLNPIWDRGSGNNTLPENSNWFKWQWPTTSKFSGCIKVRDIPGIGKWKIFTIAELDKFCKKDIHKPTPQVSTHTTPSSKWEMLMPNSSRLIPSRLTRESLVKELEKRNFRFNNKENKDQLINLLENQLVEDTKKAKIAHNQTNNISNKENRHIFEVDKFPLNSGWSLKANQKFG